MSALTYLMSIGFRTGPSERDGGSSQTSPNKIIRQTNNVVLQQTDLSCLPYRAFWEASVPVGEEVVPIPAVVHQGILLMGMLLVVRRGTLLVVHRSILLVARRDILLEDRRDILLEDRQSILLEDHRDTRSSHYAAVVADTADYTAAQVYTLLVVDQVVDPTATAQVEHIAGDMRQGEGRMEGTRRKPAGQVEGELAMEMLAASMRVWEAKVKGSQSSRTKSPAGTLGPEKVLVVGERYQGD